MMEGIVRRILGLLGLKEHDLESLKSRLGIPPNQLRRALEWGVTHKLWLKLPYSERYASSDTGELILARYMIKDVAKAHPMHLPQLEIGMVVEKPRYAESSSGLQPPKRSLT